MQDASDRMKRRRLNGDEAADMPLTQQERMLHAAAGANNPPEATNADLTNLLFRQRLLAAEKQQAEAGLAGLGRPGIEASLLGGNPGADPMVAHLRQNLLNKQLQAARLQSVAGGDDLAYLRGAEASTNPLYASLMGGAAPGRPLPNSLLLEQALANEVSNATAAAVPTLAEQISQRSRRGSGPDAIRALLDSDPEGTSVAAAAAGEGNGNIRHLLGLADGNSQAALLARIQNERAIVAARMGAAPGMGMGIPGAFPPTAMPSAALHSLISRPNVPPGAAMNRDMMMRGGPNFMGIPGGVMVPGGIPGRMPPKKRPAPTHPNSTGRQPIHLFMSCDMDDLSPYQCLVRKQIELFEAEEIDAETNARGRNRPIVVGQVGIRCKHCKMLPPRKRERAAIYYPSKLDRLYQAGQTMASVHLGQHCNHIPEHLRQELARLREGKSAALAGKKYWSDGARALGVIEDDERLFFKKE